MQTLAPQVVSHAALATSQIRRAPRSALRSLVVRAEGERKDSYQKIEEPVRTEWPAGATVGPEPPEAQFRADEILKSPEFNRDTQVLGTDVGFLDAMRFKGAAPEVINCRLAMTGFMLATFFEATTGRNVFEQVQSWPLPTALVFISITIASLIPILRGQPRRSGWGPFTSDAEIWNGRVAMLGIVALIWTEYFNGHYLH